MTAPAPIDPIRLLSSVGHDLRQPIQAMRLFVQLLQSRLTEPKHVELANRLEEAMEIGAAQMDAVLTLASLATGTARLRVEQVPLAPLLTRVAAELSDKAADAGLQLRTLPANVMVQTDPVMLDRLLKALIENAIIHARPGRRILVGLRRAGGPVLLVADDGPGIPADERGRMLEPGGRLERPSSARRGLGLGLSICHQIAHQLGHELTLGGERGLTVKLRFGSAA